MEDVLDETPQDDDGFDEDLGDLALDEEVDVDDTDFDKEEFDE